MYYILIQIFIIAFKIGFFWANTSMPTVNPIFHTLLIGLGRYGIYFFQWISFYGLNWLMVRSPERIFEFWKQRKVKESQIWRIRLLNNDFCFVFSRKFSHNQAGIQVFRYESGGDALHTQNMNHNVLSPSMKDIESLCYLFNANTTIFEHNFLHFFDVIVVNRCGWTTRMRQVFYYLTPLTECFMPLKFLRSR